MAISRRDILRNSALAGIAAMVGGRLPAADAVAAPAVAPGDADPGRMRPRPAGQQPVFALTTTPMEKVRVAFIGLSRGMSVMVDTLKVDFAEVVAVCDSREDRATKAADACEKVRGRRPLIYTGTQDAWEKMVDREDIDVVYICTPWGLHVPMAERTMQQGKHAFIEVAAAVTVDECWRLVDTSERTQRHCVMLENCCYGEQELFVLTMVRAGVFGELTHAECAYIHDLRSMLFRLGTEGDWRRDYHRTLNGNLYPTHGLGPVAQYLGIGRGDQMKYLVAMSSPEKGLSAFRERNHPNGDRHAGETYICGDMNTAIIKTELGRTIMIQHDVISPRPYSRINALSGTGGTFFDYPPRLAIDDPKAYGLESKGSHEWLGAADLARMRERFTHPLWKALGAKAKGGGHGGMDFVMTYRHLDCIRKGLTPDSVCYDAAAWSSIIELSCRSVASGSLPVNIPDFTRGAWKTLAPLGVVTV